MIKRFVLIVLVLGLSLLQVQGQQEFAPVGTTWYYSVKERIQNPYYDGYRKMYSEKDTVVNGQLCRKISSTLYISSNSTTVDTIPQNPLWVYNSTDTVFYYHNNLAMFVPFLIFNVAVGDTIIYFKTRCHKSK
jgi:hypothetical protein